MATHCQHCLKHFRWTRPRCPYCHHSNPRSPSGIAFRLLTVVVTGVAIWFVIKAAMEKEDAAAGVVQPQPQEESVFKLILRTPEPSKPNNVRF